MNNDTTAPRSFEARFRLARAWHRAGNVSRALSEYRELHALDPTHDQLLLWLGTILAEQFRLDEALEVFRSALRHHPHESHLHKQFVNTMLLQEGLDAVFRHYRLERADPRVLSLRPDDVLVCTVLRNEMARLPYFFEYYRKKGVKTFFAVDNSSTDDSLEYLLNQPDVYVWCSELSFHEGNFGAAWFEPILRQHGQRHWCLIVDADELFYYPNCESRSIPDLCAKLDRLGKRAMNAILLDMYSDRSIQNTQYEPGQAFETVCPYFDRRFYHTKYENAGPYKNQTLYYGGVRERVFGKAGSYILSKVPLLKYDRSCVLTSGQHLTNLKAERIASETACLLHFKYFSTFPDYVSQVANRRDKSHWIMQYREYERALSVEQALSFYDPFASLKLEDSAQLVQLGVMRQDPAADAPPVIDFPEIEPLAPDVRRPTWSVMLTVYRRTEFLPLALQSVLAQAPGPDDMQIEIVSDGPPRPVHDALEAQVRVIAGDRVQFYRHPTHAGHPEIFNVCVRRAKGYWIHILHDDDWVDPGFYAALAEGIRQAPEIGAAFSRHQHASGEKTKDSALERESPGILEGWIDRIAGICRLQTASIVVRREVYERLGGYCPQARSAFDWEMWQRIALDYPVWFEPRVLAHFRESESSETARLIASGGQIADARAAMNVAQTYLPRDRADRLGRIAAEHHALRAIDLAQKRLNANDASGALENIREGVLCSQSDEVTHKLLEWLTQPNRAPHE